MDYTLVIILLVFVAFIFLSNRRRKSATQQLENSVKVGAKAVMLGGITGTISEIRDTTLVVETLPGTKIEFLKAAVRSVSTPSLDAVPAGAAKSTVAKKSQAKPVAKKSVPTKPAAKKSVTTKPTVKKPAK